MRTQIVHDSPRGRIARRVAAAGMALAAMVMLAGCHEAQGGGYIGAPPPQTTPITSPTFNGAAKFGFNFQCDDGVKGQITYHDASTTSTGVLFIGLRLHGTVENVLVDTNIDDNIPAVPADTCEQIVEARWAQFEGSYRSQETGLVTKPAGRFVVVVFDQDEPGSSREPGITGDGFSIQLHGGPYLAYTRAGYIEGGNIQVDK